MVKDYAIIVRWQYQITAKDEEQAYERAADVTDMLILDPKVKAPKWLGDAEALEAEVEEA